MYKLYKGDCLKEIPENTRELNGYVYVELDCILTDIKNDQKLTGQRIEVVYNHVLRSGGVTRKTKKSFISHVFCPFCGVKY